MSATSAMRPSDLRRIGRGADGHARELARAVVRTAEERGLVDIGYGFADSPLGSLLVAVGPDGLLRLAFPNEDPERTLQALAGAVSPRIVEAPRLTDPVRRELDEYFAGHRRRFQVPVDLRLVRGFTRRVLSATARIPYGRVLTYREVAGRAGSPAATRAAGNALGSNPIPIVVPCHRVVRTGGGLGGYTGGLERKSLLLRLEGAALPELAPRG